MDAELKDIADAKDGKFRVGIPTTFTTQFFIKNVVAEFQERYPNIEIDIIENHHQEIETMQFENKLDFSIAAFDNLKENLKYQYLFEEEIGLVVKNDDPLIKHSVPKEGFKYNWIPLKLVENRRFAFPHGFQQMSSIISNMSKDNGLTLNPSIRTSTAMSQMDCVAYGNAISIMPETLVYLGEHKSSFTMLSFGNRPVSRKWMLSYHKDHYISKPLQEMIDLTVTKYTDLF